jgi:hypothetical protein
VLLGLLLVSAVAAAASLVLRFRRSRGVERQQLKWFTYAATLVVLLLAMTAYLPGSAVIDMLSGLLLALIPVSAGLAILRYRLYDIDRLINPRSAADWGSGPRLGLNLQVTGLRPGENAGSS